MFYYTKVFFSSLDSLERIVPWMLSHVPKALLEQAGANRVEVAFDELITNIYEHAYGKKLLPIFIKLKLDEIKFHCEIYDKGPAFNPLKHSKEEYSDEFAVGGYGLTFMKAVFKNLNYEFKHGMNCISFEI